MSEPLDKDTFLEFSRRMDERDERLQQCHAEILGRFELLPCPARLEESKKVNERIESLEDSRKRIRYGIKGVSTVAALAGGTWAFLEKIWPQWGKHP